MDAHALQCVGREDEALNPKISKLFQKISIMGQALKCGVMVSNKKLKNI